MRATHLPSTGWGVYGWLTATVTFKDGQKIDLHGQAVIDFVGQLQRGGWKLADEQERKDKIK